MRRIIVPVARGRAITLGKAVVVVADDAAIGIVIDIVLDDKGDNRPRTVGCCGAILRRLGSGPARDRRMRWWRGRRRRANRKNAEPGHSGDCDRGRRRSPM